MTEQTISLMVVNYHYIGPEKCDHGIHNISVAEFESQLEQIHKHGFSFVSSAELIDARKRNSCSQLPKRSCLITFDDGLKESFDFGFLTLQKKGIPALFFALSSTLEYDHVVDVHKIHRVRHKVDDAILLRELPNELRAALRDVSMDVISAQYPWDDHQAATLKYLLNFMMPSPKLSSLLDDWLEKYLDLDPKSLAEKLYMTSDQLKVLGEASMLGTHGMSHRPLATLDDEELEMEITKSKADLEAVSGARIETIGYPYGGESAIDGRLSEVAAVAGLQLGFTMIRGLNPERDILHNPFFLKRLDTNDIYGGKSESRYKEMIHG